MTLDKYDRILLDELLKNGRASFAQLAKLVNLSAPAVAERVAKLEASGVITGYEAKVDLSKVGLPIQCIIELRMGSHGNQQAYKDLWKVPELIQCYRVTGDPCVIMRAAVDSMPHRRPDQPDRQVWLQQDVNRAVDGSGAQPAGRLLDQQRQAGALTGQTPRWRFSVSLILAAGTFCREHSIL